MSASNAIQSWPALNKVFTGTLKGSEVFVLDKLNNIFILTKKYYFTTLLGVLHFRQCIYLYDILFST